MMTPRLSNHARQRCEEMDVRTKRAKRIVQDPDIVRPCSHGHLMAVSDADPDIAVVFHLDGDDDECPTIITVLPRTYEEYER